LGDSFAPLQVFNAFLHSAFSVASKLRTAAHDIRRMFFFITGLASFSFLVLKHLSRLTSSASLEDRAPKAKPSMVAAAIPQNLLITGLKMLISFFVVLDNSFYRKQNERKIMKTLVLKRRISHGR
jgi:hypothetical protein